MAFKPWDLTGTALRCQYGFRGSAHARKHAGLRGPSWLRRLRPSQQRVQARVQLSNVQWLGHEVIRSRSEDLESDVHRRLGAVDQNRDVAQPRLAAKLLTQLHGVAVRQPQVQHDDLRLLLL